MGESALALVARLVSRPALFKGYSVFQEEGVRPKEVVEVTGEPGTGKSLFLLDLIKNCILPKSYGGSEADVIYIDADFQLNIFQLAAMLEVDILQFLNSETNSHPDVTNQSSEDIHSLVDNSLKRLNIFSCGDMETLYLQFHYFKTYLIKNPKVSIIVLDNIASFYWKEIPANNDVRKKDFFVSSILNHFYSQLRSFNISFIYTRPSYFFSHGHLTAEYSSILNLKNVNTSINLSISKREETVLYLAETKKSNVSSVNYFKILNDGRVSWLS